MIKTWLQSLREQIKEDSDSYIQKLADWPEPSYSNLVETKSLKDIYNRRAAYPAERKLHISGYETLIPALNDTSADKVRLTSFDTTETMVLFFTIPETNELLGRLKLDLLLLAKMKAERGDDFDIKDGFPE